MPNLSQYFLLLICIIFLTELIFITFFKLKDVKRESFSLGKINNYMLAVISIAIIILVFIPSVEPSHCNTRSCNSVGFIMVLFYHIILLSIFFLNRFHTLNRFIHIVLVLSYLIVLVTTIYFYCTIPRWTPDIIVWRDTQYENYSLPRTDVFVLNFIVSVFSIMFGFRFLNNKIK